MKSTPLLKAATWLLICLPNSVQAEAKGVAIVNDGSKSKTYSYAYEFSSIETFQLSVRGSYRLVLPDGSVRSGLGAHLRQIIEYPLTSRDWLNSTEAAAFLKQKILEMEAVSAEYEYARPYMKSRLPKVRKMLEEAEAGNVLIGGIWMPESEYRNKIALQRSQEVSELTIGDKRYSRVTVRGITGDEVILSHASGTARMKLIELGYDHLQRLGNVNASFRENEQVKACLQQFIPELKLANETLKGVRVKSLDQDWIVLESAEGERKVRIRELDKSSLQLLTAKSPELYEVIHAGENFYQQALKAEASNNWASAYEWYEKAVAEDHALAKANFAALLMAGLGGSKDAEKAQQLLHACAKEGDAMAAYNMGLLLMAKEGTEQPHADVISYFEQAAKSNIVQAHLILAILYADDRYATPDRDKSLTHMEQAVRSRVPKAEQQHLFLQKHWEVAEQKQKLIPDQAADTELPNLIRQRVAIFPELTREHILNAQRNMP